MTLEELEAQYRAEIDRLTNQLQNVILRLLQTQTQITQIGTSLENMNSMFEDFIQKQQETPLP